MIDVDVLALVIVIGLVLCAAIAIFSVHRSGNLFAWDIALVIAPPFAFLLALNGLNEPAETGVAPIIYPYLVLALSIVALQLRVFLLPLFGLSHRVCSVGTFFLAMGASAVFGALVKPWYE